MEVAVANLRHYSDICLEYMTANILDSLFHDRNSNPNVRRKGRSNYLAVMFGAVLLLPRRYLYKCSNTITITLALTCY